MSPLERPVPPAGEEIHLPGASIQPVLVAAFLTVGLVGLTTFWPVSIAAAIALVLVIVSWVRGARADIAELPLEHDPH